MWYQNIHTKDVTVHGGAKYNSWFRQIWNRTKKQKTKIARENSILENSTEIPPEYIKVIITSKMRFIKGALRLAKVHIFGKPYMCMIDCGEQSSLVNSVVLNSLNINSEAMNIKISTCGSSTTQLWNVSRETIILDINLPWSEPNQRLPPNNWSGYYLGPAWHNHH